MIIGEDRVIRVLTTIGDGSRAPLRRTMETIGTVIEAHVKMEKLSGQALHRRTGNLSRSITHRTTETGGSVNALVGTNASYARSHEYGAQGVVNVPAHTRMQRMAFGKPISERMVEVRAHPMKQNIPERSFLRSSLNDKRADSVARIRKTMRELMEGA